MFNNKNKFEEQQYGLILANKWGRPQKKFGSKSTNSLTENKDEPGEIMYGFQRLHARNLPEGRVELGTIRLYFQSIPKQL